MSDGLNFEGKKFVSAREAAKLAGYTSDYVGQLCRGGKLECRMVGRSWFVSVDSVLAHKEENIKQSASKVFRFISDTGIVSKDSKTTVLESGSLIDTENGSTKISPKSEPVTSSKFISVENAPAIPVLKNTAKKVSESVLAKKEVVNNSTEKIEKKSEIKNVAKLSPVKVYKNVINRDFVNKVGALTFSFLLVFGTFLISQTNFPNIAQASLLNFVKNFSEDVSLSVKLLPETLNTLSKNSPKYLKIGAQTISKKLVDVYDNTTLAFGGISNSPEKPIREVGVNHPVNLASIAENISGLAFKGTDYVNSISENLLGSVASSNSVDLKKSVDDLAVNVYVEVNNLFSKVGSSIASLFKSKSSTVLVKENPVKNITNNNTVSIPVQSNTVVAVSKTNVSPTVIEKTITNNPVQNFIYNGVTEDEVNSKLNKLNEALSLKIYNVSNATASNGTYINNVYNNVASPSQKIDFLRNTTLENPTSTGGTFTNPTINNATFTGNLSTNGQLTVSGTGTSTLSGDVNFSSGVLYVDSINSRVGIGTSSPTDTLSVTGPIFLADSSPSVTTNRIYSFGGQLYYNGSAVGSGGGGGSDGNWTFFNRSGIRLATTSNQVLIGASATSTLSALEVIGNGYFSGNLGLGTTTPGQKISVAGDVLANNIIGSYFTATSTTATSTLSGGVVIGDIGSASTTGALTVANLNNYANGTAITIRQNTSVTSQRSMLLFERSYGTVSSPTAIPANELSGVIRWRGYDGSSYQDMGQISMRTTATPVAGQSIPGEIVFHTVSDVGSSNAQRAVISSYGHFGIATTSPYAKLSVVSTAVGTTTFALRPVASQTANILDVYSPNGLLASVINSSGNWGLGTSSPGQKLSVGGDILGNNIIGSYFTATSTNTASTFPYASTTALTVSGSAYFATVGGSVGIGTTTPGTVLSVSGVGNFASTGSTFYSTLAIPSLTSTSTATSTFTGGIATNLLNVTSTTASSTFANGVNLTNGCYAINGTCITGGGSGSGTVNTGVSGYFAYYPGSGTTVDDQTVLNLSGVNVGIGTSSPLAKLSIHANAGETNTSLFAIASSTSSATSTLFVVTNTGAVGIGTTSPYTTIGIRDTTNTTFPMAFSTFNDVLNGSILVGTDTNRQIGFNLPGTTGATLTGDNWATFRFNGAANKIFLGDTGTNAWIQSIHALNFSAGSSASTTTAPQLTLLTTGNLGIGTTTPGQKLSVAGDILGNNIIGSYFTATSTNTASTFPYASTTALSVSGSATFAGNGIWNSSGGVGIGTTSPASLFEVVRNAGDSLLYSTVYSASAQGFQAGVVGRKAAGSNSTPLATLVDSNLVVLSGRGYTGNAFSSTANGLITIRTQEQFSTTNTGTAITFETTPSGSTSRTETMRLSGEGNLGIGTSTPGTILSINQVGNFASTTSTLYSSLTAPYFTATSTNTASTFPYASSTALTVSGSAFFAGSGIWNSSGNVGIGTTSPNSKLHLYLDSNSTTFPTGTTNSLQIENINTTNGSYSGLVLRSATADAYIANIYQGSANSGDLAFLVDNNTSGVTERLRITSSGRVGISTTTPGAMLSVINTSATTAGTPLFLVASTTAGLSTTTLMVIQDSGNVGIKMAAPAAGLAVNSTGLIGSANSSSASNVDIAAGRFSVGSSLYSYGSLCANGSAITCSGTGGVVLGTANANAYTNFTSTGTSFTKSYFGIGTTSPGTILSINDVGNFASTTSTLYSSLTAPYFTATSTNTASTFPYASTTALSATTICLTGDTCRTTWPSSTGGSFPFTATTFGSIAANSTTTLIGFTNGIYSLASSTIGNGTQNGGLTITGGATTTGNAYIGGMLGVGTNSPQGALDVRSDSQVMMYFGSTVRTLFKADYSGAAGSETAVLFGGTQNVPFNLLQNNSTRVTIDTTGYLGIGTTSPGSILSVSGVGNFAGTGSTIYSTLALPYITATSTTATSTFNGFIDVLGTGTNATSTFSSNLWVKGTLKVGTNSVYINDAGITLPSTATANFVYASSSLLTVTNGLYLPGNGTIDSSGNLGLGTTSPGSILSVSGVGNFGASTSTLYSLLSLPYITATSTTATSTFAGNVEIKTLNVTSTTATSTFASGVNLSTGCYAINGACIGSGSGSGTVNTGVSGYFAYYPGNGTTVDDQTVLNISGSNIGIGTTTPGQMLSVGGDILGNNIIGSYFTATSSTATSTFAGGALFAITGGNVGIGSSSPFYDLSISGSQSTESIESTAVNQISLLKLAANVTANNQQIGGLQYVVTNNPNSTQVQAEIGAYQGASAASSYLTFSTRDSLTSTYGEKMRIGANGYLGIGTTTPNWNLQLAGSRPFFALSDTAAGLNLKHWAISSQGGTLYISTSSDALATSTTPAFMINNNGNVGIGTTSPYANLSVTGLVASSNYNADNPTATSTFAGGFTVGGGQLNFDYTSGITSFNSVEIGSLNFDTDAGQVSWADLPVSSTTVSGLVQSYSAMIANSPILTIYGEANNSQAQPVKNTLAVGIGTTTPVHQLDIQAGSTTPFANGKTQNYYGINVNNLATSSTASIVKAGIALSSTGSWSGTSASNVGLYVYGVTGGTKNFDAIFNGGGNVGIGTTSPYAMLSVAGDVALPGIGNGAGTAYVCTTLATGVLSTSTAACNPSSLRFKDNVTNLSASRGLADVMRLRPVTFTYKPEMRITGNQVGFIAEEIVSIIPEAVGFDSEGLPYNVDYSKLTPVLAKAIQEIGNVISLKNAGTTTPSITVDTLGNVGIGTTTPDYKLQIAGDVAATSFVNVSTRDAKKDIAYISNDSKRTILDKIKNIKVAEYRYNNEPDSNPLRMGLIAEEAPAEILSVTGKGVDVYKMSTFILAGVQEQQARLEAMDARITKLETLIGSSTPVTTDISFGAILTSFENAGVKIENGITKIKNAIVDSLTVGSKENTAGITLYDTVTKEPYCLTIENGTPKSTGGACGSNTSSNPSNNISTTTAQTGDSDLIPPVITITGANPAQITKGSVYVDLGATVDDNVNHNLGITTVGDVNTSVVGTYPIVYSATDQAGNTASTTRSVIVSDPNDIIIATSTENSINSDIGTTTSSSGQPVVGN